MRHVILVKVQNSFERGIVCIQMLSSTDIKWLHDAYETDVTSCYSDRLDALSYRDSTWKYTLGGSRVLISIQQSDWLWVVWVLESARAKHAPSRHFKISQVWQSGDRLVLVHDIFEKVCTRACWALWISCQRERGGSGVKMCKLLEYLRIWSKIEQVVRVSVEVRLSHE